MRVIDLLPSVMLVYLAALTLLLAGSALFLARGKKTRGCLCLNFAAVMLVPPLLIFEEWYAGRLHNPAPETVTIWSSKAMNESVSRNLPEKPSAQKAVNIVVCNRNIRSLVGYEVWARFEFESDEDYATYKNGVMNLPDCATTASARIDGYDPPEKAEFFWNTSEIAHPLRAETSRRHWLFDDANRRVYAQCHD